MNTGKTVFAQIMDFLPLHELRKCIKNYNGHHKVKSFSCLEQFLTMAFAQLTFRESLRDIETCMRAMRSKLYHMGIRSKISRNTLANANEKRNWRIYADFSQILIQKAKHLYANEKFFFQINQAVYAFDSSVISLALSICPWSKWNDQKIGGVKLHTLLNLNGSIPSFIKITSPVVNDFEMIDNIIVEPGAFYVMDRGFIDLSRLYTMHQSKGFFITREKTKIKYKRLYSRPVKKTDGLRCDQTILFCGRFSGTDYPEKLRRVRFFDSKNKKYYTFWTNNFLLPALTIANLYRCRWQIELFFKWIKQHLKIKKFYGTSENAVKTQIFIAVCIYILIAVVKKQLDLKYDLYSILQVFSVSAFERTLIKDLFSNLSEIHLEPHLEKQQLFTFKNYTF